MSKLSGLKYASSESDAYQPGSRKRVLRNLKGITRMHSVENEELAAYMKAERMLAGTFTQNHRFRASDICHINKTFLGEIYSWAGSYRDVNLSKGGFTFATAMAIPRAMKAFERNILARQTPCSSSSGEDLASRLAIVHVELLLIHPFREGNGRTARLLATLMAYQAGMPGLDFGFVGSRGKKFKEYVAAIQAGMDENYRPMATIMKSAIRRSLQKNRSSVRRVRLRASSRS